MSTLWHDGQVVGETTSAAWGHRVGACVALGMLRADLATPGTAIEVEVFGERRPATVQPDAPLWDPGQRKAARMTPSSVPKYPAGGPGPAAPPGRGLQGNWQSPARKRFAGKRHDRHHPPRRRHGPGTDPPRGRQSAPALGDEGDARPPGAGAGDPCRLFRRRRHRRHRQHLCHPPRPAGQARARRPVQRTCTPPRWPRPRPPAPRMARAASRARSARSSPPTGPTRTRRTTRPPRSMPRSRPPRPALRPAAGRNRRLHRPCPRPDRRCAPGGRSTGIPLWLSVTVDDRDGSRLRSGEPWPTSGHLDGVAALLANCSAPEAMDQALPHLAAHGLPFGAYANGFQQITADFLKDNPTVDALSARPEMTPTATPISPWAGSRRAPPSSAAAARPAPPISPRSPAACARPATASPETP
jgi:hypothetical protein